MRSRGDEVARLRARALACLPAARVAAPAAASSAAAESAPAATTTATRPGLVLRLVHAQLATVEVFAVQRGHGRLGVGVGAHRDEREAARAAGLAVAGNGNLLDGAAVLCERGAQRVFGGGEVEVADVELASHWNRPSGVLREARVGPRSGEDTLPRASRGLRNAKGIAAIAALRRGQGATGNRSCGFLR